MSAYQPWTDEDSKDLDERNRRVRKPRRYVAPISVSDSRQAVARRPINTLDQFSTRPAKRRLPSPEARQAKEWERTKESLQAAGVRVVETPPGADAQPCMAKRKSKRTPTTTKRTPRQCADCGADISSRGKTAVRCEQHAYVHGRALARARTKANKESKQ